MNDDQDNKIPTAVALRYDGKHAPKVTTKGTHELAERIRELAIEHEIPMFDNPELTMLLAQLDLGEEIPQSLYIAVAEIISFAYILSGRVSKIPGKGLLPT